MSRKCKRGYSSRLKRCKKASGRKRSRKSSRKSSRKTKCSRGYSRKLKRCKKKPGTKRGTKKKVGVSPIKKLSPLPLPKNCSTWSTQAQCQKLGGNRCDWDVNFSACKDKGSVIQGPIFQKITIPTSPKRTEPKRCGFWQDKLACDVGGKTNCEWDQKSSVCRDRGSVPKRMEPKRCDFWQDKLACDKGGIDPDCEWDGRSSVCRRKKLKQD